MSTTHTSRSAPAPANGGVRRLVGGIAARTAVRALALLVLFWGQMWLWDTFAPSTDANIGAGLLAFLTVVVLSGVWGLLDGRRHGLVGALAAWVLAASVFDAVAAVAQDSRNPKLSPRSWACCRGPRSGLHAAREPGARHWSGLGLTRWLASPCAPPARQKSGAWAQTAGACSSSRSRRLRSSPPA